MLAVLFVSAIVLLVIGVPVSVALAVSTLLYVMATGDVPDLLVIHRMEEGVDSFPLLAVPFFILAGILMNTAGITNRIFDFAKAVVGWMRGGLGHVNIGASVIFAGMSGAAVADAGGLGTIEIRAMRDAGYDLDFSVGVTAASSTIGPIIPPSLPMVVYGVIASTSIGKLFAAGIVPGFLMAGSLMVMVAWFAKRRGYPRDTRFSFTNLGRSFARAFLSLLTPAIIIGGIISGAFTPTEAAIAAVAYALFLGVFVYRTMTWTTFVAVTMETIETTAIIMFVVASASAFAWVLTSNHVTEYFATFLLGVSDNPTVILLLVNVLLFAVGCFMETLAAIMVLVPVLLPTMVHIGVDPVHFGVVMVLNLMIGLLTPPVGIVLYVLARVSGLSFERTVVATSPFLVPLVVVLLLVTLFPEIAMVVPNLMY